MMSNKANKVKYNLRNVHIAKCTVTTDEVTGVSSYTYDTPRALPGAVNLSLSAEGEASPFYADGIVYFKTQVNNGYSGDLELAILPDWFRQEILGEYLDESGVLVEKAEVQEAQTFAMLFEFEGDQKAIRHVLYRCSASTRPEVSSQTKEDTISPVTETISITADARQDGLVKAKTGEDTGSTVYTNWYGSVYEPSGTYVRTYAALTGLTIGSLVLDPVFAGSTTVYTTATTNSSDLITASASVSATIVIKVNGATIQNNTAPEWRMGANTVLIMVSEEDKTSRTYTVTVTKS